MRRHTSPRFGEAFPGSMAINCFSIAATEEAVSSINSDIMGVLGIVTVNIVPEKFYFSVKINYAYNNVKSYREIYALIKGAREVTR